MKPALMNTMLSNEQPKNAFAIELYDQVRRRAYDLYGQRGKANGNALDDWLQAESEVVEQWSKPLAA